MKHDAGVFRKGWGWFLTSGKLCGKNYHVSLFKRYSTRSMESRLTVVCVLVYRMVPHLTAVLSTTLPMLGMVKHDNMKWVFSAGRSLINISSLIKHEELLTVNNRRKHLLYILKSCFYLSDTCKIKL